LEAFLLNMLDEVRDNEPPLLEAPVTAAASVTAGPAG